ncbi:Eco57I restriction-modification methylase domain-containing protein, partial [Acidilobus sp.]|uniref:Eco57I restriction-modification methylase domain-containing protein n=1 Tax=Acidilobus sp. TaxID=1872109 RepID=UPI003CFDE33E
ASYSALMDTLKATAHYRGLDIDMNDVGKRIIEDNIYGVDALKYAAQITAINLALLSPGNIAKENIHTIYLGYIPEKNQPWLGSLELLSDGKRIGGILSFIEGYKVEEAQRVTLEGSEGVFEIPDKFDLVIMNPPFTRATGRVSEEFKEKESGRGLFGFITDKKYRQKLLDRLNKMRDSVRNDMLNIAKGLVEREGLSGIIKDIVNGRGELKQYLNIGQAGEGLLFLYLAYKYVRPGGVIAFVLPKNVLSGVSWFLARALLASEFHVKYVIVSSDVENGYNFSESTSLSESLIVARRVDKHEPNEETVFVILRRKPKSAIEAMLLAEEIMKGSPGDAEVVRVKRADLLRNLDNWGLFTAFSDASLVSKTMSIMSGGLCGVKAPVTLLGNVIDTIGIDAHQFHNYFEPTSSEAPYPVLFGGGEENRVSMAVRHNMFARPRSEQAKDVFYKNAGNVLVPDRIRANTAHVTALYSDEQLLSNIFYAIRLKCDNADKALVAWLNTTWGLMTILAKREETMGAFIRLKMGQWRSLPVLDVCSLSDDKLSRLAEVFDKYSKVQFRRIPEQYGEGADPNRLGFDLDVLKALSPVIDEDKARLCITNIYRNLDIALKTWTGHR